MQCVLLFVFMLSTTALRMVSQQKTTAPDAESWWTREEDKEGMMQLDGEELMVLCHSVGLVNACEQLATWSEMEDSNRMESQDSGQEVGHCLPEGKIVFQHVMKTGGLSVDSWFQQTCDEHADALCSIKRHDGRSGIVQPKKYHQSCAPSICTTHGAAYRTVEACGPSFEHAARFTVIRDPVTRVWSFYNYISRWYKPYQQTSLKEILSNYETWDPNHGLSDKDQCLHCHKQLSNAMAKHHFAGPNGTLKEAKRTLENMKLVIETHSVDKIPALFADLVIFPESKPISGNTAYTMPRSNPSNYRWGKYPDSVTEALIKQYNQMDIELYQHATKQPNYIA